MPYIAIKTYPKDQATIELMVEKVNAALLESLGCSQQAITISVQEVAKEDWQEQISKPEIEPNMDKMMIFAGERRYK